MKLMRNDAKHWQPIKFQTRFGVNPWSNKVGESRTPLYFGFEPSVLSVTHRKIDNFAVV
jgi:hypothetical protein